MAASTWMDWLNLLVSALTLLVFVVSIRFLGRQIREQQRQIAQQQLQIEKADLQVSKEHDWNRRKAVIELSLITRLPNGSECGNNSKRSSTGTTGRRITAR